MSAIWYLTMVERKFAYWLFDLDNTLYPPESGLFDVVDGRINKYLQTFFDVPPRETGKLRKHYFRTYGLTLIGLMRERKADPEHYLEYVHRVPVKRYLKRDHGLLKTLQSIAAPKAIFTNGSRSHSLAVMGALGVSEVFREIFDIASTGYIPKPDPRSYRLVLERLGVEGGRTVLVEDMPVNLAPARALGMTTILVGKGQRGGDSAADHMIASLDALPGLLSELGA
jgi:putative hydrolase of the HAD superfamily